MSLYFDDFITKTLSFIESSATAPAKKKCLKIRMAKEKKLQKATEGKFRKCKKKIKKKKRKNKM